MSTPSILGPKSIKNHKQNEVNYLDSKNSRTTKNELYQLYSQGKLIHTEKYTDLEDQLNKLLNLSKEYIKQIREQKETIDELRRKIEKLEYVSKKNEEHNRDVGKDIDEKIFNKEKSEDTYDDKLP